MRVLLQTSFHYVWLQRNLAFNFLLVPTVSLICVHRRHTKIFCVLYFHMLICVYMCVLLHNFSVSCMLLIFHATAFGSIFFCFPLLNACFFNLCHISFSLFPPFLPSEVLIAFISGLINHCITSCKNCLRGEELWY